MTFDDDELKLLALALEWSNAPIPDDEDTWTGPTQTLFERIFLHLQKVDPDFCKTFPCRPESWPKYLGNFHSMKHV